MPELNVIFHGLGAVVCYEDHIELLIPVLREDSYGAGTFNEEVMLQKTGMYALEGVDKEKVPKDKSTQCTIFQSKSGIKDIDPQNKRFCVFSMPFPKLMAPIAC